MLTYNDLYKINKMAPKGPLAYAKPDTYEAFKESWTLMMDEGIFGGQERLALMEKLYYTLVNSRRFKDAYEVSVLANDFIDLR